MARALALLPLVLWTTACAGDEDTRPVEWSYIHAAIILPNCATATCHSAFTKLMDLNLEDRRLACEAAFGFSINENLLRGTQKDTRRMPPDQPLPEADIDLIAAWLNSGQTCEGE